MKRESSDPANPKPDLFRFAHKSLAKTEKLAQTHKLDFPEFGKANPYGIRAHILKTPPPKKKKTKLQNVASCKNNMSLLFTELFSTRLLTPRGRRQKGFP